jgi:signal transduction histidine kinase
MVHGMKGRWGLQAKMTATYVAVTAGVVLLTELVIFGVAASGRSATALTAPQLQARAELTAAGMALKIGVQVGKAGRLPGTWLGSSSAQVSPGQAQPDDLGGVTVPQTSMTLCDVAPASFAFVESGDGTVLATSYPACFPVGGQAVSAQSGALGEVLKSFSWRVGGEGHAALPHGDVVWAAAPIVPVPPGADLKAAGAANSQPAASASASATATGGRPGTEKVFGTLYVEVPAAGRATGGITVSPALIRTGIVTLVVAIPAGLAFGLLSTRRLTRRLRRLAGMSLEVAEGRFERRVPVSGQDEVSRLEENFNRMAGQLQASLDARRQLAEANARHEERTRIARELHDSISQELFSLRVLAGGLRRALPAGSAVLTEVETMERTAGDTMREMQSLLLALRPVALDELGLASAIEDICHAYTQRLGVRVLAELEPLALAPGLEHAILRVTQEALANAVRHADADHLTVRLRADAAQVMLEVTDNGHGFDADAEQAGGAGLGLRVMRDRVAEAGGVLSIVSAPGLGTQVRAAFPRGREA